MAGRVWASGPSRLTLLSQSLVGIVLGFKPRSGGLASRVAVTSQ